jgi:hypothetical protein
MSLRRIAFVNFKTIPRILQSILSHEPVPVNFRHNGSRRNRPHLLISFHNGPLRQINALNKLVAVNQYNRFKLGTFSEKLLECLPHCDPACLINIYPVDDLWRTGSDPPLHAVLLHDQLGIVLTAGC